MASGDGLPGPIKLIVLVLVLAGIVWASSVLSRSIGSKIASRSYHFTSPVEPTAEIPKECIDLAHLRAKELLSNKAPAEAETAQIELKGCPSKYFGTMNLVIVDDKAREEGFAKEINIIHLFSFPALYLSTSTKLPPQPVEESSSWDDW